ncbi:MAG: aminoacetone oxidase family FAD-binding enzyme [Candidatus Gottesmanbacteria bacterium]|nr:aminoacetone oxidase family FAD-binding enzyme [Candidatus Gottesmanbacteria bacterium]
MAPQLTSFDVAIIGGGAAGIMAAFSVKHHHPSYSVAILDRTNELGRKFLTAGAGRGNLTNRNLDKGPDGFFHGDRSFISSIFTQFGYADIMKFFLELGVPVYEEKKTNKGKIFPVIDHAKTVRDMMVDALREKGISIFCTTSVSAIVQNGDAWNIVSDKGDYSARVIILSSGGKTYPSLGSDGSGYDLATSTGHTIIPPVVSAVPIVSKNLLSHYLQGEKMIMQATSVVGGQDRTTAVGDVMFTQYGFSGPAILDISYDISVRIHREKKTDTSVRLSFFPNTPAGDLRNILEERWKQHPTYPVAHSLWGLLTQKASGAVCAVADIPKEQVSGELTPDEINRLIQTLTAFTAPATDTRGWNEAEFTAGGVDTLEVDGQTLASKKANGLYLAGEILNVDGMVGGYNLSWAWASGWVAGKMQGVSGLGA